MIDPTFTILMPIVRPPVLMPFAIQSILNQTRDDFELFIVCDGAPAETMTAANGAAEQDGRIRAFSFPKGERHGETHRHAALQEGRGRFVCQLADDDLWLPHHLQEMAGLLSEFEFGNLLRASISVDAGPSIVLGDLADLAIRDRMTSDSEVFNLFGLSQAGYRMETYRRLPIGWSPAPSGFPTDLAMWRKFLALPGIAAGTRFVLTSVHFDNATRQDWSLTRRREEIVPYAEMITQPHERDRLCQLSLRGAARLEATKMAVRDYHRKQSEAWRESYRQVASEFDKLKQYLFEVSAAGDYHQKQSEAWQENYRQVASDLDKLKQYLFEVSAARDYHQKQSEAWQKNYRQVASELDKLKQ